MRNLYIVLVLVLDGSKLIWKALWPLTSEIRIRSRRRNSAHAALFPSAQCKITSPSNAHEWVIAIRGKREFKAGDHAACNLIHREEPGRPSLQFYFIVILISCCGRRGRGQGHPLVRSLVRQSTKTENEGRELDTQGRATATTGGEGGGKKGRHQRHQKQLSRSDTVYAAATGPPYAAPAAAKMVME